MTRKFVLATCLAFSASAAMAATIVVTKKSAPERYGELEADRAHSMPLPQ